MNAARVESSARLLRVLEYLKVKDWATSMELILQCAVVAPATVVSELRHQGYAIECKRAGNVWRYHLVAA